MPVLVLLLSLRISFFHFLLFSCFFNSLSLFLSHDHAFLILHENIENIIGIQLNWSSAIIKWNEIHELYLHWNYCGLCQFLLLLFYKMRERRKKQGKYCVCSCWLVIVWILNCNWLLLLHWISYHRFAVQHSHITVI